jgi:hypothetical protein
VPLDIELARSYDPEPVVPILAEDALEKTAWIVTESPTRGLVVDAVTLEIVGM